MKNILKAVGFTILGFIIFFATAALAGLVGTFWGLPTPLIDVMFLMLLTIVIVAVGTYALDNL